MMVTQKFYNYQNNLVFLILLSSLVTLHAWVSSYFVGATKIWSADNRMPDAFSEWIISLSPIAGGVSALLMAHYVNLNHRPFYIGIFAIFHATIGLLLITPNLNHANNVHLNHNARNQILCDSNYNNDVESNNIANMVMYQFFNGISFTSIVTLGIVHLDENKYLTPLYIGFMVFTAQIGRFIGLQLILTHNLQIFYSFAWGLPMTGIFIIGLLIIIFPKYMTKKKSSQITSQQPAKVFSFFDGLHSLFNSKLFLLNSLSATFMYTAVVNYSAISEKINISYYLKLHSDNNHPNVLHFWILGVVSIIILIMSKIFIRQLPSTKFLVYWLIAAYTTILALFVNHKFFSCNDETNFFKNNIALKECNFNCGCEPEFEPVCLDGYTYYSACYAGCTVQNSTGYYNCQCGTNAAHATLGYCSETLCLTDVLITQFSFVIISSLVVSTFMIHVLIAMRTVRHHNLRASGIGFLLLGILLFPYHPFKLIYEVINWSHCMEWFRNECVAYTEELTSVTITTTIIFMILSIIPTMCMLCRVRKMEKKSKIQSEDYLYEPTLESLHVPTETEDLYNVIMETEENSVEISSLSKEYDYLT